MPFQFFRPTHSACAAGRTLVFAAAALAAVSPCLAQLPTGWKQHDWERPLPPVVVPAPAGSPAAPPSDAIVLFDGSGLDAWTDGQGNPSGWKVVDGAMESVRDAGYAYTKQAFGDIQLHLEFASPARVEGRSQGRGNSGVFLMGQFEVQVLDSFENRTYADGHAGAVYGQYPPLVNASRRPGEWQSYDIVFRRPRFGAAGELTEPARITVFHNGVLVQDHVRPLGPTRWMQHKPYINIGAKAPLALQDHGNPVRYRNIWVRQLDPHPYPPPEVPYDLQAVQPPVEELQRYVGRYGGYRIELKDKTLHLKMLDFDFPLLAHGGGGFALPYTAATVKFLADEGGPVTALLFTMGGDTNKAQRDDPVQQQ